MDFFVLGLFRVVIFNKGLYYFFRECLEICGTLLILVIGGCFYSGLGVGWKDGEGVKMCVDLVVSEIVFFGKELFCFKC